MPSVLILGATSSVARAIAARYAEGGTDLVLGGRNEEELALVADDLRVRYAVRVSPIPFDALRTDEHPAFWRKCLEAANGEIEGAILCFAYMTEQAAAQADFAEAHTTIDAGFIGTVSILMPITEMLQERGGGFICVLSSVSGDRGRQSNYVYGSAKAALNIYLQGLRNRLFRSGIPVTTIKPGFMDSRMTYGLPGLFLVASPDAAAKAIVKAIRRKKDVVYVPWFWRYIMWIIRAIPEPIFKRLRL